MPNCVAALSFGLLFSIHITAAQDCIPILTIQSDHNRQKVALAADEIAGITFEYGWRDARPAGGVTGEPQTRGPNYMLVRMNGGTLHRISLNGSKGDALNPAITVRCEKLTSTDNIGAGVSSGGVTGRPVTVGAPIKSGASGESIEGVWAVNFNNYKGTMEIRRDGDGWTADLQLPAPREPIQNVAFDSRTGRVSFYRPRGNQSYAGTLSGDTISGKFNDVYNWSAIRQGGAAGSGARPAPQQPSPPPAASGTTIQGTWTVNFNNYKGTMEIGRAGTAWSGRLKLGGDWEPLNNVAFDGSTGRVSFFRPRGKQNYVGTLSGNSMNGKFNDIYNWSATR